MTGTRSISLCYTIRAPLSQVLAVVPRLLSEDDSFGLDQEPRRELAWRLRHLPDNRPILWLVFRSTSDEQSELIAIPGRVAGANTGLVSLIPALATIVMRLRDHGLAVVSKDYAEKALAVAPVILLVAPSTRFDRSLVTCVELVADQYGFVLHWSPRAAGIHPARLQHDVAASRMVIADLTTESGRAAVEAAGSHGRRLVVIAPEGAELGAAWQRRILFYDENRAEFLQALADEIAAGTSLHRALTGDGGDENHPQRAILDPEQTIPNPLVREPWGGNQAPVPVPGIQPGAPDTPTEVGSAVVFSERLPAPPPLVARSTPSPDRARRAIYRATALDPQATAERRFHAARILAKYGDREAAATALGEIARAVTPLRDEALMLLGRLGEPARVALWALDASEENPRRSVTIASQLHAAGDTTTARLRLECLARHPDSEVRLAALQALGDLGVVAYGEFAHLLRQAEDARMQLEAARWLRLHQLELPLVIETLVDLAGQPESIPLALDALQELAAIRTPAALEALTGLAHSAEAGEMRLAAAQMLRRQGDPAAARNALLALAATPEEDATTGAAEGQQAVGPGATDERDDPMHDAALTSVRRRAAARLATPDQPEAVQQEAVRVLLALNRFDQALPALTRLALTAQDEAVRRWSAGQLVELGAPAVPAMLEVLDATGDRAIGRRLAEALLGGVSEPLIRRRAATWLAAHGSGGEAVDVLADLALDPTLAEREAHAAFTDLARLVATQPEAVPAVSQLAREAPIPSVRRRALDFLRRRGIEEPPVELTAGQPVPVEPGAALDPPVPVAVRTPVLDGEHEPAGPVTGLPRAVETGERVELIFAGLKSFSQVLELQKAVQALPEVARVKVQYVQKGILNMEVHGDRDIDLASRVQGLPGFALRLAAREVDAIRFELQSDPTAW